MFKFADDTCLVAPAINTSSYLDEIVHIESWASENNLKLNCAKSKEIYFVCEKNVASRHSCRHRVWTLRESTAWKSWALLLKRSNTYIACWHHSVICCTLSMCYAVTASQLRHYTKDPERQSSQRLRTARQRGLVAVRHLIEQNLTILSDVVSASVIAITEIFSAMPMTHHLTVLWQTVTMCFTCIYLKVAI